MKKEILIAVLCFTLSAIVITLVGMFVCPEIGGTVASYYTDPAIKSSDISQTGKASVPEKTPSAEVAMKTDSEKHRTPVKSDTESVPDEATETDVEVQTPKVEPSETDSGQPEEAVKEAGAEPAEKKTAPMLVADAGKKTAVKAAEETHPPDAIEEPETGPGAPVKPVEDIKEKAGKAVETESLAPGKAVPEASVEDIKEKAELAEKAVEPESPEKAVPEAPVKPAEDIKEKAELAEKAVEPESPEKAVPEAPAKPAEDIKEKAELAEKAVETESPAPGKAVPEAPVKPVEDIKEKAELAEKAVEPESPEKAVPEAPVKPAEDIEDIKEKAELAEKAAEPESPEKAVPEAPVKPVEEDIKEKAELAEKAVEPESPAPGKIVPEESAPAAKEPKAEVKKRLTAKDISKLTKSLKKGESLKLSDGRIAYKVNSGDVFSRICQKVLGTSLNWRKEAEKMGINPGRIFPGKVLIFEN
ncbi:hypothetical protein QUF72_00690 [Desulfobacterales bacterium HSG2]|nr:hypothetical protein [Desulfobacterales bacterium HSG2]MDM8548553.1 hypothetical protein [Desulfobacterales bacterium HSG2]